MAPTIFIIRFTNPYLGIQDASSLDSGLHSHPPTPPFWCFTEFCWTTLGPLTLCRLHVSLCWNVLLSLHPVITFILSLDITLPWRHLLTYLLHTCPAPCLVRIWCPVFCLFPPLASDVTVHSRVCGLTRGGYICWVRSLCARHVSTTKEVEIPKSLPLGVSLQVHLTSPAVRHLPVVHTNLQSLFSCILVSNSNHFLKEGTLICVW